MVGVLTKEGKLKKQPLLIVLQIPKCKLISLSEPTLTVASWHLRTELKPACPPLSGPGTLLWGLVCDLSYLNIHVIFHITLVWLKLKYIWPTMFSFNFSADIYFKGNISHVLAIPPCLGLQDLHWWSGAPARALNYPWKSCSPPTSPQASSCTEPAAKWPAVLRCVLGKDVSVLNRAEFLLL